MIDGYEDMCQNLCPYYQEVFGRIKDVNQATKELAEKCEECFLRKAKEEEDGYQND